TLNVKFYIAAGEKKPDVKVYTADEESIPSGVIYRYNESLGAGVTASVQQAKDGLTISVYRQIRTEKGETKRTLMSNNYYAPIHEVIETSNEEVIVEEPVTQNPEVDSSFEVNEDTTEVPTEDDVVAPTEDDVVAPTPPPNEPTADELKNATVDYSEDEDYYYYIYSVEK
ncbi:MAG: G5 domain-containing protein, partial [Kurthia sp.]|nr:G5 domain-containing protein [Kurthia sp.]